MPGKGKLVERHYNEAERESIQQGASLKGLATEQALAQLGVKTYDVYLNDNAFWSNVPENVWNFTIGGYQVLKKWLSYRESSRTRSHGNSNLYGEFAAPCCRIVRVGTRNGRIRCAAPSTRRWSSRKSARCSFHLRV